MQGGSKLPKNPFGLFRQCFAVCCAQTPSLLGDGVHTCSLRCIFCQAHVLTEYDSNFFRCCCSELCEGDFIRASPHNGARRFGQCFDPSESMENAGILDVFPIFHTARLGQKIRRSPQHPLCGVALEYKDRRASPAVKCHCVITPGSEPGSAESMQWQSTWWK